VHKVCQNHIHRWSVPRLEQRQCGRAELRFDAPQCSQDVGPEAGGQTGQRVEAIEQNGSGRWPTAGVAARPGWCSAAIVWQQAHALGQPAFAGPERHGLAGQVVGSGGRRLIVELHRRDELTLISLSRRMVGGVG
jgi:hypothetical protein